MSIRFALKQLQIIRSPATDSSIPTRAITFAHSRAMSSSSFVIPKTMRGVQISKTGGPEVLEFKEDIPVPTPGEGEVLVKNESIAVNFIDTYFRTGLYPAKMPLILGKEGAGTVVAIGPDSSNSHYYGLSVGDRIAYLATFGGYAEYTVAPAIHTYPIPSTMTSEKASASMIQGLTAISLIREAHKVEKGQWVLVHAASGGMGQWLCQLLRAVGARVIGTASTAEKIAQAKKNGAEFMINYKEIEDWMSQVKRIVKENSEDGEQGVHVVFDGVGADTFDGGLEVLRRKGSMISFGNASGAVPPLAIARLAPKNIRLLRPQLFPYITLRSEFEPYVAELFKLVQSDDFHVGVHGVYDLKDVKRAHEDLEGRKTMGKVLLRP